MSIAGLLSEARGETDTYCCADRVYQRSVEFEQPITVSATTAATTTTTGALVSSGGLGVSKDVYIGGDTIVRHAKNPYKTTVIESES